MATPYIFLQKRKQNKNKNKMINIKWSWGNGEKDGVYVWFTLKLMHTKVFHSTNGNP
jgi:hypothetical protein